MRIVLITTAAALTLALAGCSNQESSNELSTDVNLAEDATANDVLGANDAGGATAMPSDAAGFATAVAASDLYEIESSKLALEKGSSAEVKSIAQMLQREHTKSTSDLKAAATSSNIAVTPALDSEKQGLIDELKATTGADFDKKYLAQQRTAHQKALMLLQNYGNAGDNDALKSFAQTAQKMVEGHLDALNRVPM